MSNDELREVCTTYLNTIDNWYLPDEDTLPPVFFKYGGSIAAEDLICRERIIRLKKIYGKFSHERFPPADDLGTLRKAMYMAVVVEEGETDTSRQEPEYKPRLSISDRTPS